METSFLKPGTPPRIFDERDLAMVSFSQNPLVVVFKLLAIIFIAEVGVMFVLPVILPSSVPPGIEALVDSCLLMLATAPLVWLVIIGPLRSTAAAEKMAAVAQIATGVAHELRNPLTSVKMLVQSHRESSDIEGQLAEDLGIIEDEIRRMEQSIQTFLEFARPRKPERRPIDLRQVVQRTFSLVKPRSANQRVELRVVAPKTPVMVNADWELLLQLLLNLVLNALDVMPNEGSITVTIDTMFDGSLRVAVADTGPGIAPEVLAKLFQPFVTNKEAGVGFGLVICKRIAKAHDGRIQGENHETGARFTLVLPQIDQASDQARRTGLATGSTHS